MTFRWIGLDDPERWDQALAGVAHAPAQRWVYCRALALSSGMETRLFAGEAAGVRVICPLSIRARDPDVTDLVSPYGFGGFAAAGEASNLIGQSKTFFRNEGFVTGYVQQHPTLASTPIHDDAHPHGTVFALDLTLDTSELMARMDQTHRYELRRTLADDTDIITDKESLGPALRSLYLPMVRNKGAAPVYHFSNETLDALANSDGAFLVGACRGGRVLAVALFLSTPWVAEYFIQASIPEGRACTRKLIWAAVEHFKARGVPTLHLGGGIRPGDNLESFKRRFGGREIRSVILKQIYDQTRFEEISKRYRVPATTEGYFPAYWKDAGSSH